MTEKRNKYLAYVRVSSHEQAERNISIPSQIDQINNYAKQNWYFVWDFYKEENSAYKWKRKIFNELLQDLKTKNDIKWVIVFKFDRLSRNLDDFVKIDKIIRDKNIELLSVTEPMLNSYLWRYLVRDMQNRAILYSEELSFRVKLWIRKKLQLWWSAWWYTPFWYDNIKSKLIPNENAKIIKEIYTLYSYWQYWIRELTKRIKNDYKLEKIPKLERILENQIYTWKISKTWELWNEEYIFWWYDKAWTYKEEYDLNYVIPIISNDLYDLCQKVKNERSLKTNQSNFTYPKIFKCSCGRNLSRDDKKWNMYLRCTNHINWIFKIKCNEKYINIRNIEWEIKDILLKICLNQSIRNEMKDYLKKQLEETLKNKDSIILENNNKLENLKAKQFEITNSFIENIITKEIFELSSKKINKDIENINEILNWLKDTDKYVWATEKTITFIDSLTKLENELKDKKSSQRYNGIFSIIANLVFSNKKVLKHQFKHPFDMLSNLDFCKWWVRRDSNPRPSP